MIEALETMIVSATGYKKLDFSLQIDTNTLPDTNNSFTVMPVNTSQVEGGVGFVFFAQTFRISLFTKYYGKEAREKLYELYEKLELILQQLYDIRVTGATYQVVNLNQVVTNQPLIGDKIVQLNIDFNVLYRRTHVYN